MGGHVFGFVAKCLSLRILTAEQLHFEGLAAFVSSTDSEVFFPAGVLLLACT